MKTRTFTLIVLAVLALLAALLPSPPRGGQHAVFAAGSAVTLMSAQTDAGPGNASATSRATPAESGADRLIFQFHSSAPGVDVVLQESCDGTNWTPIYRFGRNGPDEIWSTGAAGVCAFRPFKNDDTTATATVTLSMSGAGVAYGPTYTPTATPTATRTPTTTPTHA
jgi:hypothetical protein